MSGILPVMGSRGQGLHDVLIKVAIDFLYHSVLILCEFFESNTFPRNIFLVKHFLISLNG